MNLEILTQFFQWMTIIGMGIYLLTVAVTIFARSFLFAMHRRFFELSRETFNIAIYSYVAFFKIILIVFVVVPYLALLVINR